MLKKLLPLLFVPLLMAGCAATFTNLTPLQQPRNADNLYPVSVMFETRQASLRWDTIRPHIMVGDNFYGMQPTPMMKNRWEGLVPVPAGSHLAKYRYKFEYLYNSTGTLHPDSALSEEYSLRIVDK